MPEPSPVALLEPDPAAPLGASDPTRRWRLRFVDGRTRFAGVTRPEGLALARRLAAVEPDRWGDALVEIALPVVLTDGAGPHLLGAAGGLVLALGQHPALPSCRVAMGTSGGGHVVGLAEHGDDGWHWLVAAEVSTAGRVAALDELHSADGPETLARWRARWQDAPPAGAG